MFQCLSQVPRQLDKHGKPKGNIQFWFPTFDRNVNVTCMPLGFSFEQLYPNTDPCPKSKCDLQSCNQNGAFCRLHCFHTFHVVCLNGSSKCPICYGNLQKKIVQLATKFNCSLLEPTKSKQTTSQQPIEDEEENNFNLRPASNYQPSEWQHRIESLANEITNVAQPMNETRPPPQAPINSSNPLQNSTTPGPAEQQTGSPPQPTTNSHFPSHSQQSTILYHCLSSTHYWFFPHHISQSTINGRQGSTACTLIALLMAHKYNITKPSLQIFANGISNECVSLIVTSILEGNKLHDDIFQHAPVYLQVEMASRLLAGQLGQFQLGPELPLSFTTENNAPATSNLEYYLQAMMTSSSPSCAIVIFRGNSFTFTQGMQNNIILLDSHIHAPHGALIATSHIADVSNLLRWMRHTYFSTNFNLCTLTMISFH